MLPCSATEKKCTSATCPVTQPYMYSDTVTGGAYCCPTNHSCPHPTGACQPNNASTDCACCLVAGTVYGCETATKCAGAPDVPAGTLVCGHGESPAPSPPPCLNTSSSVLPSSADFSRAETALITEWDTWLAAKTRFRLPSQYWSEHIDIWLAQVRSLGRIGNTSSQKSAMEYGAGEVYGDDFEGVEEGWMPRAMDYFGFAVEAEIETEMFLDPTGNLDRAIKGSQYRNGLAQHYAASHATLSGRADWLRSVAPILIANTNWTTTQRHSGYRDNQTKGLLPKKFYDSSDVRIPAFPVYSNVACWRGAADAAFVLSALGVDAETQRFLSSEADAYRNDLLSTLCREANTSVPGEIFMPLSLEIGDYNGTGPKPPNEQPYPFVPNVHNILSDYWSALSLSLSLSLPRVSVWVVEHNTISLLTAAFTTQELVAQSDSTLWVFPVRCY